MRGKRENTNSLKYQGRQELIQFFKNGYGTSKHDDKMSNLQTTGKYQPNQDKIYTSNTFDTYCKGWEYFCKSLKASDFKVNGHKPRTLEEAKEYLPRYLDEMKEKGLSASTIRTYFTSAQKVFGVSSIDINADGNRIYDLPIRHRADITRSRGEAVRDKHVSLKNNEELISFCQSTGLRGGCELRKIKGDCLVQDAQGNWRIHVTGKGKKVRESLIIGNQEQIERVVTRIKESGDGLVWEHVPTALDVHHLRAEYAAALYKQVARPIDELSKKERYYCRGDMKGVILDRAAMKIVSENLGHSRIEVFAENYAYMLLEG